MGQKIRPNSLRTGISRGWLANWFPKKMNFKNSLEEDVFIREMVRKKIDNAGIDKLLIERTGDTYKIFIRAARPGLIIGRGGKGIEDLTKLLENGLKKIRKEKGIVEKISLSLNIEELKRQEVSAGVIAKNISMDLEKRLPYRRAIKKYLDQIIQNKDVLGAKIMVKGRLNGAEIARAEHLEKGSLPLQTLRANIDYGTTTASTTYGAIGIKVWIYKGEVFVNEDESKQN
ncbi:30S ribosomal protein S3 [Candidatus Wolfebacteria bacterium]|nr:30S ribosomal protein S3 [Candidatus Wolfebacteria bacterium]